MKHYVTTIMLIFLSAINFHCFAQKLANENNLEVITWNLEWFGNPNDKGPDDEWKQMVTASQIINNLGDIDVIVFEEICDRKLFQKLADTTGYNFYLSPGDDGLQKIGLFYSKKMIVVEAPVQILPESKGTFAQRQPVKFTFKHSKLGEVTVIGVHLKANIPSAKYADREDSYQRRKESAAIIQDYIAKQLPTKKVIVMGDWNDDVDVSNHTTDNEDPKKRVPKETPFKSIINDGSLRFVTYYLPFAMIESSEYGSVIDHICISNELFNSFRSAAVIPVKEEYKGYLKICSDHYPMYAVFEGN